MSGELYRYTHQRLSAYRLFSASIVEEAAAFAQAQAEYSTYEAVFKAVGMPLQPTLFTSSGGRVVPVIDLPAREGRAEETLVFFLPMGNSLDHNQLYQLATIAAAFPRCRIIAFGNHSGPPYAYAGQQYAIKEWFAVAFRAIPRPLVSVELEYLAAKQVSGAVFVGYSFGAAKATIAAHLADDGVVKRLITVDPVAHPRSLIRLARDFKSTLAGLDGYVQRVKLPTFVAARRATAELVNFNRGLVSRSNLAIGMLLARYDFTGGVAALLHHRPDMRVAAVWAGKSELGNTDRFETTLRHILADSTAHELLCLPGDVHAFANDVILYTAILKSILRK